MKHLLSVEDLSIQQSLVLQELANEMRKTNVKEIKRLPALSGKTVANLFFEDSTRTRLSFEIAAKRLSADVVSFAAKGSSVSKGESDVTFGMRERKYATLDRMTKEYKASKDKRKSQTELGKPYDRSVYTKFDKKEFITPWKTEYPSSETYQVPRGSTNTAKAERGKTASRQKNFNKRAIDKASKPKKLY